MNEQKCGRRSSNLFITEYNADFVFIDNILTIYMYTKIVIIYNNSNIYN